VQSPGQVAFNLSYVISPIILTGGIASWIPGGMLPIVSITQALDFVDGLLSGAVNLDLDRFFAHFHPLPGSTLIDQSIAKYPFANQTVAANAVIRNPKTISMKMICPAPHEGGYALKSATMLALQAALEQHNASGGTYTIATPSYFYTNCVFLRMTDTSETRSLQAQNTYTLDFEQPLLTLQAAFAAQNNLMQKVSSGLPLEGGAAWSGLSPTVGNPASLGGIGTIPALSGGPAGGLTAVGTGLFPGPQQ
jgi:hypothetical protein